MPDKNSKFSSISEFYSGKSVLITGATGLVGKVLLYKILLSIKSIETIFILIRGKSDKNLSERFSELIERSRGLFDGIAPETLKKVVPIECSLTTIGLCLNESDRKTIVDKVSVIFHCAADVTFNTNLRSQLLINVGATKEIIDLCRQLKQLDLFAYVSTAYSNPLQMIVREKIYKSDSNPLELLEIARNSQQEMNSVEYMGKFPNTYSFTKNLAENLVEEEFKKGDLPATVIRPGIVFNSIREPACGWYNSITSVAGSFLFFGLGLGRVVKGSRKITADGIPVDIVANTCIASAYGVIKCNKSIQKQEELVVYNCNSSCLGAITVGQMENFMYDYSQKYPLLYTVRPVAKAITKSWIIPLGLIQFITETCFAYLIDLLLLLMGKNRVVVKKVKIFHKLVEQSQPFVGRQWYFTNDNMIGLWRDMTDSDKNTFYCDIQSIDWYQYMETSLFFSRKLFLKETDKDLKRAQRNHK